MFLINYNIATGLALFTLLAASSAYAENDPAAPNNSIIVAPNDVSTAPPAENPADVRLRSGSGNPAAGRSKSELCQGCHGEDGNSPDPMIPNLAGQYAKYIYKQIRDFQAGLRTHQIMSAIAASVNNDDLPDITAYFASQSKMKGDGSEGNPLGKNLFLNGDMTRMIVGCVNCHGVNGKGKTPKNAVFPVIGGQHKEYLAGQLVNFREANRTNSPGGVMNIIAQRLTDDEIEAVADYVSRQ